MTTFIERTSSLFDTDAQVMVNPVNTVGVMGGGLAKAFKTRYPAMFADYKVVCDIGFLRTGSVWSYVLDQDHGPRSVIICLPTKGHWRHDSKVEDVRSGLIALRKEIASTDLTSIAVPALGCGLGGLDWDVVREVIVEELEELDLVVELYPPQ